MDDNLALVIDDEKFTRHQMCDALKNEGFQVVQADDGNKGLQYFLSIKDQIDLVVIEVQMSKTDGWKTCQEIRSVSQVPIILISKSDGGNAVKAYDYGADQYILKPFSSEVFQARVRAVMRRVYI